MFIAMLTQPPLPLDDLWLEWVAREATHSTSTVDPKAAAATMGVDLSAGDCRRNRCVPQLCFSCFMLLKILGVWPPRLSV